MAKENPGAVGAATGKERGTNPPTGYTPDAKVSTAFNPAEYRHGAAIGCNAESGNVDILIALPDDPSPPDGLTLHRLDSALAAGLTIGLAAKERATLDRMLGWLAIITQPAGGVA